MFSAAALMMLVAAVASMLDAAAAGPARTRTRGSGSAPRSPRRSSHDHGEHGATAGEGPPAHAVGDVVRPAVRGDVAEPDEQVGVRRVGDVVQLDAGAPAMTRSWGSGGVVNVTTSARAASRRLSRTPASGVSRRQHQELLEAKEALEAQAPKG